MSKKKKLKIPENSLWSADELRSARDMVNDFQTPPEVCLYMASLVPKGARYILEPTPGNGNIVRALKGYRVTAPKDFFSMDKKFHNRFDCVVMNPPFSCRSAILDNAPELKGSGMKIGYHILTECMKMSDHVIALMPWFTISDSDTRMRMLSRYGIRSITALPRKTFSYARIQTMIIHLEKGYRRPIEFRIFESIQKQKAKQTKLWDY